MKKTLVSRTDRRVGQLLEGLSGSDNGEIQKKWKMEYPSDGTEM